MLSYFYKCPLQYIDNLSLNDFYGLYSTLQKVDEAKRKNTPIGSQKPIVRKATKKEVDFVNRYIEMKKKRE